MSDNYDDDDFNELELESEDETPKGLRKAANRAKQLERELNDLKRRLAFTEAGIPLNDPKMNYFVKGYEGEMSAEAIRQAALEAGFLQAQQPVEDQQATVAAAAQQRVMAASAGAAYEDMSEDAALAQLEAAMEEGGIEAMLDVARQFGIPTNIDQ